MVPDPSPALPPSIPEIQAQIDHLEAAHKAKNFPLSGRIIHLCHHLPVEITRVLPRPTAPSDGTHSIEGSPRLDGDGFNSARGSFSASATAGVLSPPRIPEFKEPDSVSRVTEDLSWKLASRRGHTAMISGMRSLSSTHEQVVVAWTGDIMQEWTDQQDLPKLPETKQAPVSSGRAPGSSTPKKMPAMQRTYSVAGTAPGEDTPSQGDLQAAAPPIQQGKVDDGRPSIPSSNQHAVYLPELTTEEKHGLEIELDKFSSYEVEKEGDGKMSYVPVFVPRE